MRLVPAALAVWAVMLMGLGFGPVGGGVATAGAGVVAAIALWKGRRPWLLAAAGCAAAAGLVIVAHTLAVGLHPLRALADRGAAVTLHVVVDDDPRAVRASAYGSQTGEPSMVVVPATLTGASADDTDWTLGGSVVLLAPHEGWHGLLPGQALTAEGLLVPADRADLTIAVLRVRGPPQHVLAPPWWQGVAATLRAGLREAAAAALTPSGAGLLPGLAVGDTSVLSAKVEADFRAAGLTHLLAVSGANLAIVSGAVVGLLTLLGAGPRFAAGVGAVALVGFVVLVRPSPSVLRAGVMAAIVLLALGAGRSRAAVPALAAAVLVLLVVDPSLAVDVGFALSVTATAALVLLAPGWARRLQQRGLARWPAEALAVSVAAFVVTAPIVAGLNGELNLVAVVANLLAAPAVAPATVLGVLAALVSPLGAPVATAVAWTSTPAVWWLVFVADQAAAVPGATLPWVEGVVGALLLVGVLVVVVALARSRAVRALMIALAVGAALVLVPSRLRPPGWPPEAWSVVACDVGQGDAIVLATGVPGWAVLVDAGPEEGLVDACLRRLGVHHLAMVVLSHLHADHVGGIAGAVRGRGVGAIALGPVHEPRWALGVVRKAAADARAPLVALAKGTRLRWPALTVDVIGPVHPAGEVDAEDGAAVNDGSLVLRLGTPAGTVLLTGDAEVAAQSDLLAAGAGLQADVLKLPHHGSRSTSSAFLRAVGARTVLVSVGAGNRYGHPNLRLLGELERAGARVRRTDLSGDLAVIGGAGGLALVARGDPLPARRRRCPGVRPSGRRCVRRGRPAPRAPPSSWRARWRWGRPGRLRRRGSSGRPR
ncbi:ComEC/Rec2 family competence protein [Pseudonocardia sp. TRM90224]|uniref:ComEC/Rec2 family competence protein n=1 Tax=Pseudonocardia sp. TRM90224 TaxID=2812678 RepID=UPI001E3870D0|nr:ComEC/Rec2 family competence protein [Pseudonocardia sp. TRM90224]